MLARKAVRPPSADLGEFDAEFDTHADALSATFSQFERVCLDVGARLGEAIPGLSDLASVFDALSGALEGKDLGAAGVDLDATSVDLGRAPQALAEEGRVLSEILDANGEIGVQIVILLECIRTISALVFTMKVEAAPMREFADDMADFADRLHRLAEQARRALNDYQETHGRLDALLRSASKAQAQFQHSQRDGLYRIAGDIRSSLSAVSERRARTSSALQDVGQRSREIGGRIGQCVMALQIGDSTRQRVEHTLTALNLWRDLSRDSGAKALDEAARRLFADDPEGFTTRLCALQSRQLEGALDEFSTEMDSISQALGSLSVDAGALVEQSRKSFGAGESGSGSFMETLEKRLAAARLMVQDCRRARAVVDGAAVAAISTMDDMRKRTAALLDIVVDVTIIGTNALLKSNRLGDLGKGIGLIAQELRAKGDVIGKGIHALPEALDRVVALVQRLQAAGASLDTSNLDRLDQRMDAAVQTFGASGKQMTAALSRLDQEGGSVRRLLDDASAALAQHRNMAPTLESASTALQQIEARLNQANDARAFNKLFDRLLRPAYTMVSERRIHDAYTGCVGATVEVQAAAASADVADAFML